MIELRNKSVYFHRYDSTNRGHLIFKGVIVDYFDQPKTRLRKAGRRFLIKYETKRGTEAYVEKHEDEIEMI